MAVKQQDAHRFTCLSFSELTEDAKAAVLRCAQPMQRAHGAAAPPWPISPQAVFSNRQSLPLAVQRSEQFVEQLDPVTFQYLDDATAAYYESQLAFAFYLALASCELGIFEQRATQDLLNRRDYLLQVGRLLLVLRERKAISENPTLNLTPALNDLTAPMCEQLAIATQHITVETLSSVVDYPASFNDGRLYLVWVAEMLADFCTLLQYWIEASAFRVLDGVIDWINFGTGQMGWSLYFLRCGTNTAFLFETSEHIKALNLSKAEQHAYFLERWQEKKFIILNDAVWGWVNFVCFFILCGAGWLGYYGDVLNGALFFFDFALQWYQYQETAADYAAEVAAYQTAIDAVQEKINALKAQHHHATPTLQQLEHELGVLEAAQTKKLRAGYYELKQLQLDTAYACAVIIAFAILCCFFAPPGSVGALYSLGFALTGAVMCFGLGIVHAILSSQLEIAKTHEALNDHGADEAYYQALLAYQHADMWCTFFVDLSFPTLLLSFVFMPTPIAASVFVLGVLAMLAAKCYVAELAPEDVREESIPLKMLTGISGFFKPAPEVAIAEDTGALQHFFPEAP